MGEKNKQTNRSQTADASGNRADLDGQYGNIGISAVAAALPYVGKPVRAPHTAPHDEAGGRGDRRKRSVLAV